MSKPFDFFNYKNGELYAENVRISDIIKKTGTPTYIYSEAAFLTPFLEFKKGLKTIPHKICFAVKSNSNIAILKLLASHGAGMDLVSGGELYRAGVVGVKGDSIVFSGVGKTAQEIKEALHYQGTGIHSFNVESMEEVFQIHSIAEKHKKTARIALRFNPDVNAKTHPYISTGLKENKFGMSKKEILELLPEIKKMPYISLEGLSIHIGSQLTSLAPLKEAFGFTLELAYELESKYNFHLSFLDFGGGIGITYDKEKPPLISDYCKMIQQTFKTKSKLKKQPVLFLEPGRTISGNAGILVTEFLYRKKQKNKDFVIVDAGMNDLMRPSLYGSYHEIVPLKKNLYVGKKRKTDIVGPVCESSCFFGKDRNLSSELKAGDSIALLSAGAYGFTMSSQYNSRPRATEVLVSKKSYRVIRNRETYRDLIQGETL